MALDLSPNTYHQTYYYNFIEEIGIQDIPRCGTLMLVDQLLNRKKIEIARSILNSDITIHPPCYADPYKFVQEFIQEASMSSTIKSPLGLSAFRLTECLESIHSSRNFKEALREFCTRFQEFATLSFKSRIEQFLSLRG